MCVYQISTMCFLSASMGVFIHAIAIMQLRPRVEIMFYTDEYFIQITIWINCIMYMKR